MPDDDADMTSNLYIDVASAKWDSNCNARYAISGNRVKWNVIYVCLKKMPMGWVMF